MLGVMLNITAQKDLEQIEEWNEYGELKAEIGAVSDPLDFSTSSQTEKKATIDEKPKPLPPVAAATTAAQSVKSSGTSTPHIQIQNPPVTENREDQRTLALRLAGEEAAIRAKENAKAKLTATTKPAVKISEIVAGTNAASKKQEESASAVALKSKEEDDNKAESKKAGSDGGADATGPESSEQTEHDKPRGEGSDSAPTAASGTRRRSVVPEIVPPISSLKRPSLANEVAAVSSDNFHAENAEILGLVGHHRGSIISATTQDEQEQVRKDIRASISEVPSDGDIDALRKTAEQREDNTIHEEESEDKEETEPAEKAVAASTTTSDAAEKDREAQTQQQDPLDESKAGVSVAD